MRDVPFIAFVLPFLGLGLGLGSLVYTRRSGRYARYRVGELAQQLGLRLVDGDPELNMLQAQFTHNTTKGTRTGGRVRRFLGDETTETKVFMQGAPYGRPTEFVYYSYTELADRVAVVFVTREFHCRLSLQLPADLPAFEIVNRKAPMGFKQKPAWDLPRQSFGDRDLDSRLALTSTDPRLGPVLAPVARGLTGHKVVHIQGYRGAIHSICTEEAVMYAVMDLTQTQAVLEHMATALVGPPR